MSAILQLNNFGLANIQEKSYVEVDAEAGASAITAKSAAGMSADRYLLINTPGNEVAELRRIASISGNVVTLASPVLVHDHAKYEDLTALQANQLRIYRAANVDGTEPAVASFGLLTTVDIDIDQQQTVYTDVAGGSDYWYRYTYYNQTTAYESAIGDSVAVRGGDTGIYATVAQVRSEAGMTNNPYVSDAKIDEARIEAQSVIDAALAGTYDVPFDDAPPIIQRATKVLAAGYLLKKEFGAGSVGTNATGQAKIDEVLGTDTKPGIIDQIKNGTLDLTDATGTVLATREHVAGWPDSTTADTDVEDGGSKRAFRMGQVF